MTLPKGMGQFIGWVSFQGEFSVLGKQVLTNASQSCFLLKTTDKGTFRMVTDSRCGGNGFKSSFGFGTDGANLCYGSLLG